MAQKTKTKILKMLHRPEGKYVSGDLSERSF